MNARRNEILHEITARGKWDKIKREWSSCHKEMKTWSKWMPGGMKYCMKSCQMEMRQNTGENEVPAMKTWKFDWNKCQDEWNIAWNSYQRGMKQNSRENEVAAIKEWKFNRNECQKEWNIAWNSYQRGMKQNSRINEVATMKKWKFKWNNCQNEWNIAWNSHLGRMRYRMR